MYDLVKDPAELNNVVNDPDYVGVRVSLEAELARLQEHYGDEPYRGSETPRVHWSV